MSIRRAQGSAGGTSCLSQSGPVYVPRMYACRHKCDPGPPSCRMPLSAGHLPHVRILRCLIRVGVPLLLVLLSSFVRGFRCKITITHGELEKHDNECPEVLLECPFCRQPFARRDYVKHAGAPPRSLCFVLVFSFLSRSCSLFC